MARAARSRSSKRGGTIPKKPYTPKKLRRVMRKIPIGRLNTLGELQKKAIARLRGSIVRPF